MKRLHFDVEADGFLDVVTRIHCIHAKDVDTKEKFAWGPHQIPQALETLEKADKLIAHFGIGYDFPVLEKVCGFTKDRAALVDSYVISKLMRSSQKDADTGLVKAGRLPGKLHGKHSIEAWGYRLGIQKLHADIEDWSVYTPEMSERCESDVDVQDALWDWLKPDTYSQKAIELEHRVAYLCRRMEAAGVPFDEKAAQKLHVMLQAKQDVISRELIAEFGTWFEPITKSLDAQGCARTWTPKRADKKAGYWGEYVEYTCEDQFGSPVHKKVFKGYPCTKIEPVTFNPSSRRHIIKKLKELGWEPEAFTESGEAKLDDDVLEGMADTYPQATRLVEYLLLDKRLGQVADGDNAWLKKVVNGYMHGAMDPMGTVHSRASHFSPNMGQVPASKSPYGAECRGLFGPNGITTAQAGCGGDDEEIVQVGADMSGLQLRALAHLLHPLDGGAYSQIVTSGDVHWSHTQAMGLVGPDEPRDKHSELHNILREKGAKTFGYAYLFGCFPPKSGRVVRDCLTTAKNKNPDWAYLFDKFFRTTTAKGALRIRSDKEVGTVVRKSFDEKLKLGKLHAKLKACMKHFKNHLPGLDGRLVPCRSDHSALNFACSSIEAILCKTWLVDSCAALEAKGYVWGRDFWFMLWVHDEVQVACRKSIAEEVGKTLVETAKQTGIKLGFRVPLASEYKIGRNWADTH